MRQPVLATAGVLACSGLAPTGLELQILNCNRANAFGKTARDYQQLYRLLYRELCY